MLDIKVLQKKLAEFNLFKKYDKALVLNNNFVYCDGEDESFAISISEVGTGIMLTDISTTYAKLLTKGFDLSSDEDVIEYRDRVLRTFGLGIGVSNEIYILVKSVDDIPVAIGKLTQAMTLLRYLDLQFE